MLRKSIVLMMMGTVAFFLCSISFADVPHMISYQGKLTTADGGCLNDTVQMAFTIYSDSLGMSPNWTETQTEVVVKEGIFNVLLGAVDTIPSAVFDGNVKYLGVQVEADPEMRPLKPMVSVAYAYRSSKADTASYAHVGDDDWYFQVTDGADTTLITGGSWGIARAGSFLYGNRDSTHVNLGLASATGLVGEDREHCTVSGGRYNTASGSSSVVGGGAHNGARGEGSTVGGGDGNQVTGILATVGGGWQNQVGGAYSTIGGGAVNVADGAYATIGGGDTCTASGTHASIGGGRLNTATGAASTVAGGRFNISSGNESAVGGGSSNNASNNNSTVGGGESNTASHLYSTVGGGHNNTASVGIATVGGGEYNTASNGYATVGGGGSNTASGYTATVGGGGSNIASGTGATIGGGGSNTNSGQYATVGGGLSNTVSGTSYSAIPGGHYDTLTAPGDFSMVFGSGVYVNNAYRVVFFDGSSSGRLGINRDDRDGGISYPIHVGTNTTNGNGAYLTAGGVWTNGSSRSFKENFQTLNCQELLKKISSLPVESWNFKNSPERHIGPVAEDFVSAFDVGAVREDGTRDNKYLSTEDIAGVALAGVKELIKENQEQKQELGEIIEGLRQRIAELEKAK